MAEAALLLVAAAVPEVAEPEVEPEVEPEAVEDTAAVLSVVPVAVAGIPVVETVLFDDTYQLNE